VPAAHVALRRWVLSFVCVCLCVCRGWGFFNRHTSDLASRSLLSPVERVHEAGEDGAPGVSISLHSAVTAILDKRRGGLLR
jgi:hypothetical protein